jgi:hypothetical protein
LAVAGGFAWRAHDVEQRRLAEQKRQDEQLRAERREVALERAVTAALNGQYDEAERQIAAAEELGAPVGQVRLVRGVVARYRDDPTAVTHFAIAAEHLGPSVAVKALLATAYYDTWDVRAEPLFAELLTLQPVTAEDHLFRGQILAEYDDPRAGLADVLKAKEMRPSPLAWLASADVRFKVAIDTGNLAEAEAAVRDADTARALLPASDHALASALSTRLVLWDMYSERNHAGDAGRADEHRAAAALLVDAAGTGRWNWPLRQAVIYYHHRTGKQGAAGYLRAVRDSTREPSVGFDTAAALYAAGDLPAARAAVETTRQARPVQGWQDLIPWVFILAEEGKRDEAWAETAALPKTPGFGYMTIGHLAWLLGREADARRVYADELAAGRVPGFQNGWYRTLARFGAGVGTDDDERALLREAGASRLRRCEASFLIAMRHLARGDRIGARRFFQQAIETRAFYYFEHLWSRNFLARMDAVPGWPGWIPPSR